VGGEEEKEEEQGFCWVGEGGVQTFLKSKGLVCLEGEKRVCRAGRSSTEGWKGLGDRGDQSGKKSHRGLRKSDDAVAGGPARELTGFSIFHRKGGGKWRKGRIRKEMRTLKGEWTG